MDVVLNVSDWFWSESFWLPPNSTWADLDRTDDVFIPHVRDLWMPLPIALVLCAVRWVWERVAAQPIGRYFKLKESSLRRPHSCAILEAAFRRGSRLPDHDVILEFSKKLDWTPRQVERWWRRRRLAGQPSAMKKFKETMWRFMYYLTVSWYGVYILWDKPWFWNADNCWSGFPRQHVPNEVWWYYMVSLGFYWALIFSVCVDNKRKDFTAQLIHHFATILLLCLSWTINTVRIGTLVLCVHDVVDYWLEGGKLLKYLKFTRMCDVIFICFALIWFITRTGIYPFCIVRSAVTGPGTTWPLYYVIVGLLLTLQLLHVVWSYKILQMAYSSILCGNVGKDDRSETEPSSTPDEDDEVQEQEKIEENGKEKTKTQENNNINKTGLLVRNGKNKREISQKGAPVTNGYTQ